MSVLTNDDFEMEKYTQDEVMEFPTIPMCIAGGRAYEEWLNNPEEQRQSNKVGNLVAKVWVTMNEAQREQRD